MKINHEMKHINEALGVPNDKYQAIAEEISEEIKYHFKQGTQCNMSKIAEGVLNVVRKEHLNTDVEPSAYELELLVHGYLLGRILSPDYLNKLAISAEMEKNQDNM